MDSMKQWALNHKDFENFRIEKIENPKEHNLKILESLKDPKVQKELQPIMEKYKNLQEAELKEMKTYRRIFWNYCCNIYSYSSNWHYWHFFLEFLKYRN